MSNRVCFIHAGTHKTGTTYIQEFLGANRAVLSDLGLYVPVTGEIGAHHGHHNIAFQLNADPLYDPRRGGVDELLVELSSARADRVCLSSENFSYLYKNPACLRSFVSRLRALEYDVKVVMFLRAQLDYAESLYAELLKWDLAASFPEFVRLLLSNGEFNYRGVWYFPIDYNRLLDGFSNVLGRDNIIAVRYRNSTTADRIVRDLLLRILPALHYDPRSFQLPASRSNPSLPAGERYRLFTKNNAKTSNSGESARSAGSIACFGEADVQILAKFWKLAIPNLKLQRKYGVFVPIVSSEVFRRLLMGRPERKPAVED